MNPSKEVGEASGEETGIGETTEGVVATLDAMTSAVDVVEAMVTAVEMREWLEMGRPETERTAAVHFFSRALACLERPGVELFSGTAALRYAFPLYWPGLLPSLVLLLEDCLLPHNSKDIQSGAILSLKHLVCLRVDFCSWPWAQLKKELHSESQVFGRLVRLVRESDYTKIRDQALWMLGRMTRHWFDDQASWYKSHPPPWDLDFLPLITEVIRKYAAIQEPTNAELSSLNNAIEAFKHVAMPLRRGHGALLDACFLHMLEILPVLIGIFQEPGNRKSVQILVGEFMETVVPRLLVTALSTGLLQVLVEMLRVGNETPAVLITALRVLKAFLGSVYYRQNPAVKQEVLDMGSMDAIHKILKRPNGSFKRRKRHGDWNYWVLDTLWDGAMRCLLAQGTQEEWESILNETFCNAVMNQEGLVELVMEMALGMSMSKESEDFHMRAGDLLSRMTRSGTSVHTRRLMFKGPLFPLLNRYLNDNNDLHDSLRTLEACLAVPGSSSMTEQHIRIRRRLVDSSGIPDTLRRISYYPPTTGWDDNAVRARRILDTYLNNPLPPSPLNKLPLVIYTRNVPS